MNIMLTCKAELSLSNRFLVTLFYLACISSLCFTTDVESKCGFKSYTDKKSTLAAENLIKPLIGKSFESKGDGWLFTIGICADLPVNGKNVAKGAAALQQEMNTDTEKLSTPHVIGALDDTHIMGGSDWVMLEYRNGEKYGSHCGNEGKRTVILLSCDETVVGDDDAKMVFIEEDNTKSNSCYYLFSMKHSAVCPSVSSSGGLSVGSILVIIFFSVTALYLLIGFLYQRFVLGSKGVEQIPNYEFWKDLGNLEADGCDFVCRSRGRQRSDGFGGIGDDQLDPTEEVRDDNLLPM